MSEPCAIKKGLIYTSPRWKGERQVTAINAAAIDGKWGTRVEFVDLRTARTGWATLTDFAANATLKEAEKP